MTPSWKLVSPGLGGTVWCVLLFSALCSCLYEYHFINQPKSWKDAKLYCNKKYDALATIANMEDMRRMTAAVGSGFKGQVWFGLHDRVKWRKSDMKEDSLDEEENEFTKWKQGEPNYIQAHGKICVVVRQGTWHDASCEEEQFPFVCYDNRNSSSSNISHKNVLVEKSMNWRAARTYCKTNHLDLANVRNADENSEIQELVGDNRSVWIGHHRYPWDLWAGDKSDFMNWVQGHPKNLSEGCASSLFDADHSGQWVEAHCGETFPFVCHNKLRAPEPTPEKKQIFRIKITNPGTAIDLNQPAVNEAILHQIKEKMEEMGITRDLKISWMKKSDETVFSKVKENVNEVKMDPE